MVKLVARLDGRVGDDWQNPGFSKDTDLEFSYSCRMLMVVTDIPRV